VKVLVKALDYLIQILSLRLT